MGIGLFAFAIICEEAHVASPIVLAWSHPGLRRIALSRPIEAIMLPVAAIIAALAVPFMVIWWVYWLWNVYHFGAQHYGVLRIFGVRIPKWLCVAVTAAIMVGGPLAIHAAWWKWLVLFAIDFNHWLVDLGLSLKVSPYWWLLTLVVIPAGLAGFLWKAPRVDHIATLAIPWVIQARWGVGIAHFLYSRWVWKLSDPRVREAIGCALAA